MPKGPKGEKRPADVIGMSVKVMRIATGEEEEEGFRQPGKQRSGAAGGKARSEKLTSDERKEIAKKAAERRWGRK